MSFWKALFGGGKAAVAPENAPIAASEDYKGYHIEAAPYPAEGQHQTAGFITKAVDGTTRRKRFVRADRFASAEDAAQFALLKARQIIDQSGDALFD